MDGNKAGIFQEDVLVEILPVLRGLVSPRNRFVGTVQSDDEVLEFVDSHDAPRWVELGTSCPDPFLRTKIKPLYVDWHPQAADSQRGRGLA